jgi:hypothetical protein
MQQYVFVCNSKLALKGIEPKQLQHTQHTAGLIPLQHHVNRIVEELLIPAKAAWEMYVQKCTDEQACGCPACLDQHSSMQLLCHCCGTTLPKANDRYPCYANVRSCPRNPPV